MKKSNFLWGLLFLFSFLLLPALTQAQKQKKIYNRFHCKLYLKNGHIVDSYMLGKYLSYTDSVVHLSDNPNGFFPKSQKYYNADIDSMLQWTDDYPELVIHLLPVKVRHSYDEDTLMVDSLRYPSMAMHQYRGKNVDGFVVWDMWNGYRYLYKTKDMDAAHAYIGDKFRFTSQRKQAMAKEFKKYPRFVNFINSLKVNSFKDNPGYILFMLDGIIEEDKQLK